MANLKDIHSQALQDFDEIQTAVRDERIMCLSDRRFYSIAGAQWEGALSEQFANRPRLEVNKIHAAVLRVIADYRQNEMSVKFVSRDGTEHPELASTCAALYRADEQDSCAEEAYDNGFEEAVGGGFGAWRLCACEDDEYDDENEHQRIRIEPIFDADSCVFFDLNAKRQDKSDATFCFVLNPMTASAYKREYGRDATTIAKLVTQTEFDWFGSIADVVNVAEYYIVEKVQEKYAEFKSQIDDSEVKLTEKEMDDDPEYVQELLATGYKRGKMETRKVRKVHKYILDGAEILEDCGYIAGSHIPIVPVYGKRWYVDGAERIAGLVRHTKDPQRLYNMQISKVAEIAATGSVEKPIYTPEQVAGHELTHAEDNIRNNPYLLVNPIRNPDGSIAAIGPQAYTKSATVPPATAALLQAATSDIQEVLGNPQAGEKVASNVSAEAIELVQAKIDNQSVIYISNMKKAIQRTGQIWLSMAKDVYVEEGRKLKSVDDQGEYGSVELMKPVADKYTGEITISNDLSKARFDVAVGVGPATKSRKESVIRSLVSLLPFVQDAQTQQIIISTIIMNLNGDGMEGAIKHFRKILLRLGAAEPTDQEVKELEQEQQNVTPDPNSVFLQASAQEAEAKAMKAKADTYLAVAKAKETEAKTVETLAGVDLSRRGQAMKEFDAINSQVTSGGEMPQPGANGDRPA